MNKREQAQHLLDNDLLVEIFSDFHHAQYEAWLAAEDREKQTAIWSKGRAVNELSKYVEWKCKGIINGK